MFGPGRPATPSFPRVLKKNGPIPKGAVYIGRPSKWGNPFPMGSEEDRDDVCDKFEEYLKGRPDLINQAKRELKGRDLVCYCAPARCHGDTLLRVANE